MKFDVVSYVCVYMLLEDNRLCSVVYCRDHKMLNVSLYFFRDNITLFSVQKNLASYICTYDISSHTLGP